METRELSKRYRAMPEPALDRLTLRVDRGELFGFLGPNGAGKTTTIRILMTLLRPTSGRAWLDGHDVLEEPQKAVRKVGFMPEQPGFYAGLTGRQHLRYWARLYGLPRSGLAGSLDELLRRVGIGDVADIRVKTYSLGMKRRLALAGALLPDPDILVLDEPTLGLDPQGIAFVRTLLLDLNGEGRTVFLSSHILSEVERICTRVGVINRGRLLRVDAPRDLSRALARTGTGMEIETRGVSPATLNQLRSIEGVIRVEMRGDTLLVYGTVEDAAAAEVNRCLVDAGVAVLSSRRLEPNLEDAFLTLTEVLPRG